MPDDTASQPTARTAFHQRIRANTVAVKALADEAAKVARDVEPRVAQIEGDLPHITHRVLALETRIEMRAAETEWRIGMLAVMMKAIEDSIKLAGAVAAGDVGPRLATVEKVDLPHIEHRVLTLEKLPHEIKELGQKINSRIDDKAHTLQQQIKELASKVKASQDSTAALSFRHGMRYAIAINSDGSFAERTTLGRLFRGLLIDKTALKSIGDIAALHEGKRAQFIKQMRDAYHLLPEDQRKPIELPSDGDWGCLFDCARELANAFAAAHPPPQAPVI